MKEPERLSAGRYRVENRVVVKCPARTGTGYKMAVTWRDEETGEMLGYTLFEAKMLLRARAHGFQT